MNLFLGVFEGENEWDHRWLVMSLNDPRLCPSREKSLQKLKGQMEEKKGAECARTALCSTEKKRASRSPFVILRGREYLANKKTFVHH